GAADEGREGWGAADGSVEALDEQSGCLTAATASGCLHLWSLRNLRARGMLVAATGHRPYIWACRSARGELAPLACCAAGGVAWVFSPPKAARGRPLAPASGQEGQETAWLPWAGVSEQGVQPSGLDGEDNESEERKRAAAKARFGSLRTATDEELRRALDGSLAVKDITRPPEPEEVHVEDVTMASDGQEPEPAAGAPSPAAPVAAPAVPPAGTGCEALQDWPDVAILVRGAACGVGFPFAGKELDEPYIVENYVGDEHAEAMTAELAKEMGFALVAATAGRSRVVVSTGVAQDLKVMERVIRLYNRHKDRDDWQFSPVLFAEMDEEFGPFTLDACVASSRVNAFCVQSWSAEDDARRQRFDGLNAWANLPFSVMYEILLNFLKCKRKQQMGTGGCFLVPVWEGDEAYEPVSGMREVFRPGDWKFDCWERYCELDDEQRLILPAAFAEAAKELS
ncbi:hypothetical protein CYMTET_17692, partial [Cymbomonas tetramitiformis]